MHAARPASCRGQEPRRTPPPLPSGIYVLKLEAGGASRVQRVHLVR